MIKCLFTFCLCVGLCANECCMASKLGLRRLKTASDVEAFFPMTEEAIEKRKTEAIEGFDSAIEKLITAQISFDNTARVFDLAFGMIGYTAEMLEAVGMVHPDLAMRKKAADAGSMLRKHAQQTLLCKSEIYHALAGIETSNLTDEQAYFAKEALNELKAQGLGLQEGYRAIVKLLQAELIDLSDRFLRNIREDKRTVLVSYDELADMSDSFIECLQKAENGCYILTTDYPIFYPIMNQCSIAATRKKMLEAFSSRGYPDNEDVLRQISCKRHGLAHVLGKQNFASLQLGREMVQSAEAAQNFLDAMYSKLKMKQAQEIQDLKANLPEGVELDTNGNFYPWDLAHCMYLYRKKHFNLDEEELKAYFPLSSTLRGLMDVYEKFMGIRLEEVDVNLWHEDVRLVRVSDPDSGFIHGWVALDLHPRPGKYTHACDAPMHPALACKRGDLAALSVLICNFPKGAPSLMRPSDVRTFFHEFGHALHDMLGRTEFVSTCGTNTKTDFVELPSQILEEWLWDKDVLQMCSSHFQTGEKLPDDIIASMQASKTAFTGLNYMRQVLLANTSLQLHMAPIKDISSLWERMKSQYQPHIVPFKDYYCLSFGHLSHYAARYYGYLWSKVFALDVFERIQAEGLLNPEVGKRYIDTIIGRGGSQDPNRLLENFLGRKPTQDAFFRTLGLNGN